MTFSTRGDEARLPKNPRARGRPRFDARTRHRAFFPTTGVAKNRGNAPSRAEYDPENRVSISVSVRPQEIPKVRFRRPTLRRPLPHVAAPSGSREVGIGSRASRLRGRRVARSYVRKRRSYSTAKTEISIDRLRPRPLGRARGAYGFRAVAPKRCVPALSSSCAFSFVAARRVERRVPPIRGGRGFRDTNRNSRVSKRAKTKKIPPDAPRRVARDAARRESLPFF